MSKMTFVVDFPDGQEPAVSAAADILGGKLDGVYFGDMRDQAAWRPAEQEESTEPSLASRCVQLVSAGMRWGDVLRYIAGHGEYFAMHAHVGLIVAPKEKHKEIQEAVRAILPVTHNIYIGAGFYPWIDGRDRFYLPHVLKGGYETGAGKAVNALVEVDKVLQEQGWPALSWAYLDVVLGVMICRSTNQNITSHMVRWLPVKVEGM